MSQYFFQMRLQDDEIDENKIEVSIQNTEIGGLGLGLLEV
jgi:hypothetical protein